MKIIKDIDLPQGSQEWLDVRSKCGMASEVGALLGVSKWEPKTPLALWKIKNGEVKIDTNFAMDHGNKYEDEARTMFEEDMGGTWEPVVVINEFDEVPIGASLDGWKESDNTILEIKCPLKGASSELWQEVSTTALLPEQYWLQCQQQLLVTNSAKLYFWVYDAKSAAGLLQVVVPHIKTQANIINAWTKYFSMDKPEPTSADLIETSDAEWLKKAKEWREIHNVLQEVKTAEETLRAGLIELSKGQSFIGGGVQLKHGKSKGRVNYKDIPELKGVNIEDYRGDEIIKHYIKMI